MCAPFPAAAFQRLPRSTPAWSIAAAGGRHFSGKAPENTNPNERRGARWDRYGKADYPTSVFLYVSSAQITATIVINTKEIM